MVKKSAQALQSSFEERISKLKHIQDKSFWGNRLLVVVLALFVGCLNGFFGGGGGMLVVPILTMLCGLEQKKAHTTAIAIILPLSLVSGIAYVVNGYYDLMPTIYVGIGAIAGGLVGVFALQKLSNKWISIIFYAIMLAAGIKMLIK